jgi:pyruvate kinase
MLYWGVIPIWTDLSENTEAATELIGRQLVARGLLSAGAPVVFVSIHSDMTRTGANFLKIQRL